MLNLYAPRPLWTIYTPLSADEWQDLVADSSVTLSRALQQGEVKY